MIDTGIHYLTDKEHHLYKLFFGLFVYFPFNSSFAGYKDWFIQDYNSPGYTIEAGIGQNPLPISKFDEIYNDNIGIKILGAVL